MQHKLCVDAGSCCAAGRLSSQQGVQGMGQGEGSARAAQQNVAVSSQSCLGSWRDPGWCVSRLQNCLGLNPNRLRWGSHKSCNKTGEDRVWWCQSYLTFCKYPHLCWKTVWKALPCKELVLYWVCSCIKSGHSFTSFFCLSGRNNRCAAVLETFPGWTPPRPSQHQYSACCPHRPAWTALMSSCCEFMPSWGERSEIHSAWVAEVQATAVELRPRSSAWAHALRW